MMQDEDRVVITLKDPTSLDEDVNDITVYVHPMHGKIFSLFNGMETLGNIINRIANEFEIKREEVVSLIKPYICNSKNIRIEKNGIEYIFPRNIIVENKWDS